MTIIASLLGQARLPDSPTPRLDAELLLAAALGKSASAVKQTASRTLRKLRAARGNGRGSC